MYIICTCIHVHVHMPIEIRITVSDQKKEQSGVIKNILIFTTYKVKKESRLARLLRPLY